MKYLDFEKQIANELGKATEPVQMDALLNALDLAEGKKRKPYPFWIIVPFLLLAGGLFYFGTSSSEIDQGSKKNTLSSSLNSANKASTFSNKSESDISITSNTQINNTIVNKTQVKTTASNIENDQNTENLGNVKNLNSTIAESGSVADNATAVKESSRNNFRNTLYSGTSYENDVHNSARLELSTDSKSSIISEISNNEFGNEEVIMSQDELVSKNSADIAYSKSSPTKIRSLLSYDVLARRDLNSLDNEVDADGLFSRMKINCPSFNQAYWRLALIPEIGVFMPMKNLKLKDFGSESNIAYNKRAVAENSLEGLNIGLYGMVVRDKLPVYLKAGVSYSRISERMNLTYEYVVQDTSIGIVSSTVSANGDTITHIYGDVITETTIKGQDRQHSYIHLFDLPVSVGYTTYIGGLDIGIEGGVNLNIMTRATGKLLTSEKDYTNLSLNRLFKNRIGVSYFGGLMIGRNFGHYGDFYLAPRFTYYPSDFSNDVNIVSQKYMSIGINAGVVYKLK